MKSNLTNPASVSIFRFLPFVLYLFLANAVQAQFCSSCTYTSATGTENYNLNSGERLCIPAGITFSGNVNGSNQASASICVALGGKIQGANLNNFGGTLTNHGTVVFTNAYTFSVANQTIENHGRMSLGNTNFNAKGIIRNIGEGHLVFTQNFTLSNGAELSNEDTVIVQGNLNGNSNNVVFNNKGFAIVEGNYASSGSTLNSGFLIVSDEINNNSGGVMENDCSMIMDGNFNNNGDMTNEGNLLMVGTNPRFQNNGGATFTNGANGHVQGHEMINNGLLVGGGDMRFTGDTRNNGGGTIGDIFALNFYDTGTPTGGIDFQNGTVHGSVTFVEVAALSVDDLKTTCSSFMLLFFSKISFPVEFGEIEASWQSKNAVIEWNTLSELQNQYFSVERSVDALIFESIGTVASQGDHQSFAAYTFSDQQVPADLERIYYRIRQVDHDGKSEVSPMVELLRTHEVAFAASVYPNPTTATTTLSLSASAEKIELLTADGRRIRTITDRAARYDLDVQDLPAGLYFVRALSDGQMTTVPLHIRR